ncbi:hypothetical protein TKK_0004266 [Trichogramma kaykai]
MKGLPDLNTGDDYGFFDDSEVPSKEEQAQIEEIIDPDRPIEMEQSFKEAPKLVGPRKPGDRKQKGDIPVVPRSDFKGRTVRKFFAFVSELVCVHYSE